MGINIPGYFSKRYSDGFLTDLYIRATAFSCGNDKAIIFSCDAIGIKANAYAIIQEKIAARCGIPANAVYIVCTHSHTSYRITVPTEANNDDDIFMHRLFQQFADCAQFAFEDLKPCSLKIASGSASGVGFIRRYRMKDGTCKTNPATGNPNIVDFDGKQDESVQLVRVVRENAKEILSICREEGIDCWISSPISTGVGVRANLALSSLDGFTGPFEYHDLHDIFAPEHLEGLELPPEVTLDENKTLRIE